MTSIVAVLSTLRRFARLGFWVGLGAGAMLIDACSSGLRAGSRDSAADLPNPAVPTQQDGAAASDAGSDAQATDGQSIDAAATSDAGRDAQAVDGQSIDANRASPADGKTDLWDTICE